MKSIYAGNESGRAGELSKLKRKCIAILCSAVTAVATLPIASIPVFADATKVVSIGNDLSEAEKKTMLKYFGIADDKSVQKITVTNKDEVSHLSSYIPREQIGTRTVSCAYIKPTESGGIKVRTANLQYVTANMIASTLADLGIKNCEVVSACPFVVSGTGALTGIIMAYETATGDKIDESKKDIATQEVVVTKDLAKDIGNVKAEYVINQAKAEAVQNNISDKQEIQNTVTNIVNNNNINISQDQIENITNLTQNIVNENYGDTYINNVTEINNNIKQEIVASDDVDIDVDEDELVPIEENEDENSILNNVDESVLGENVIASSTDDPAMITDTTDAFENANADGFDGDDSFTLDNEETFETETPAETPEETQPAESEEPAEEQPEEVTEAPAEEEPAETEAPAETPEEEQPSETPEETIPETTEDGTVGGLETPEDVSAETEITIPEDKISDFGYDLAPILEKHSEDTVKKFLKIEKFLKENFAFDETKQEDSDAAADLKIGDTEEERKESPKESISAVSKSVLDVCYKYLTEDEHEKGLSEIIKEKISDMAKDGQLSGDVVTKMLELYHDFESDVADAVAENTGEE